MLKELFHKKKAQEEIEDEITKAVNQINSNEPAGNRDFSKLLHLDKELVESDAFKPIMNINALINNYTDAIENIPEMEKDIQFLVKVYKHLGLLGGN